MEYSNISCMLFICSVFALWIALSIILGSAVYNGVIAAIGYVKGRLQK